MKNISKLSGVSMIIYNHIRKDIESKTTSGKIYNFCKEYKDYRTLKGELQKIEIKEYPYFDIEGSISFYEYDKMKFFSKSLQTVKYTLSNSGYFKYTHIHHVNNEEELYKAGIAIALYYNVDFKCIYGMNNMSYNEIVDKIVKNNI